MPSESATAVRAAAQPRASARCSSCSPAATPTARSPQRLTLSVKTIETYRSRLNDKLGLHSRADLVRLAMDLGLLTARTDEPLPPPMPPNLG